MASERDKAIRAACSAGKFIAKLPQIPASLKDDPDLIEFMQWWEVHRKRDKLKLISNQRIKVGRYMDRISNIRKLGGRPNSELSNKLKQASKKLRRLLRADATKRMPGE
jgi:hypothetical protein